MLCVKREGEKKKTRALPRAHSLSRELSEEVSHTQRVSGLETMVAALHMKSDYIKKKSRKGEHHDLAYGRKLASFSCSSVITDGLRSSQGHHSSLLEAFIT